MIYICGSCGFLFRRMGEVYECPFCEKNDIRSATGQETKRFQDCWNKENSITNKESTWI